MATPFYVILLRRRSSSAEVRDFETALVAVVKGLPVVKALTAGRVFPSDVPQKAARPTILYDLVIGDRERTLDGACGITRARVRFRCQSPQHADVKALRKELLALDDFKGPLGQGVTVIETNLKNDSNLYFNPPDGTDAGIHEEPVDFLFRYRE